jgi:hypothetical protein
MKSRKSIERWTRSSEKQIYWVLDFCPGPVLGLGLDSEFGFHLDLGFKLGDDALQRTDRNEQIYWVLALTHLGPSFGLALTLTLTLTLT